MPQGGATGEWEGGAGRGGGWYNSHCCLTRFCSSPIVVSVCLLRCCCMSWLVGVWRGGCGEDGRGGGGS